MDIVRIGVIGCGGMGRNHMKSIAENPRLKLTAVSDSFEPNLTASAEQYNARAFPDAQEMLASGLIDAVLIATPHYFHPPLTIAAMRRGIHVMCEKPLAVTVKAAEQVVDEAERHPDLKFALMFQVRTAPKFRRAKQIIESGELGELHRVHWTITTWFRTQAYYDSGSWRATWEGEGGGVLLNQCPHNLDILWWLTGLPSRIHAHIGIGKYHKIEVEDEVVAYMEYPNGATGLFVTSTGESPGTDYFEIIGDKGKLVIGAKTLELHRNAVSMKEFRDTSAARMAKVECVKEVIEPEGESAGHHAIWANFADAIVDQKPLIAPGVEGIHSVELVNAMLMSGLQGQPVDLPIDREGYEQLLQGLIEKSRAKKTKV
jgi:predicted dehydrogenase